MILLNMKQVYNHHNQKGKKGKKEKEREEKRERELENQTTVVVLYINNSYHHIPCPTLHGREKDRK